MTREEDAAFQKWYKRTSKLKVSINWGPSPWVDIDSKPGKGRVVQCTLSSASGHCSSDGSIYLVRGIDTKHTTLITTTWLRQQDVKKGKTIKLLHPDSNEVITWTIESVGAIKKLNKDGHILYSS